MNLPTQLTILRILLTPIFVGLLFMESLGVKIGSLAVFIIASLTDWYDGYVARKIGVVTMWGQFLDPLADKILVSSALICFSVLNYIQEWMVLIIIIRDLIITAMRSYAVLQNQHFHTNFLAKVKTCSQVVAIYLVFIYYLFTWPQTPSQSTGLILWIHEAHLLQGMMYIVTILTVFSGVIYLIENRTLIRKVFSNLFRIFVPTNGS